MELIRGLDPSTLAAALWQIAAMVFAVMLVSVFGPLSTERCVDEVSSGSLERLANALVAFPAVAAELERKKDPIALLRERLKVAAKTVCSPPAPVLLAWWEWSEDDEFPRQAEVEAVFDSVVATVVAELTARDRELESLDGRGLCASAMKKVAPLLAVTLERGGAGLADSLTAACVRDQLPATHRAALLCYARVRTRALWGRLEALSECDGEIEPTLDEWLTRFEAGFQRPDPRRRK